MSTPVRTELLALLRLAAPLLATGLGYMLLGVVDTAIVGRLGEGPLGAVGLGNNVFFTVSVLGWGWMLALDPLIAQAVGAGEAERARATLWQGVWVSALATVPLTLLVMALASQMGRFGVPAETVADFAPYLVARSWSLFPFMLVAACRSFLQGHEVTRPLMFSVVLANVINLPLSWVLVFGAGGWSGLGAEGAGWASTVSTIVQAVVLAVAVRARWGEHRGARPPDLAALRKIFRLGTPIGLQLVAEVGSFAIVGVLMSALGTRALGAHQVALMLISVTFQIPLALGASTATRVGHAIGRDAPDDTRRAGLTGIATGAAAMLFGATFFLLTPEPLARILTDEIGVVRAAVPLLAVAAAFQISDGVQAVAAGALRGAGDTRWPLASNIVGHYAVGVPLGAGLAFGLGWGAVGLWWGLSAGLTAVAIALTVRFWLLTRGRVARA
ncbi:MAG: MATE family efflux transporter [Sandaracinaceae bacterium]|nr:MATE family efflux transporter [Sandaracinaceae bacterium]